jgi:hypothetical protein
LNCIYNQFFYRAEAGNNYSLATGSKLKVLLLRSTGTYVPDPDHKTLADIFSNGGVEISVTSYLRQSIANRVAGYDDTNNRGYLDCDNINFGTLESGQTVVSYVIFENNTTDGDSVPYYHCDGKIDVIACAPAQAYTTGAITGITKASPGVVTANAHGLVAGDKVKITEVVGMTEVNDVVFTVGTVTANTFQLSGINTTAYTTYVSGGVWSRLTTVYVDAIEEDIPTGTAIDFGSGASGVTVGLTSRFSRSISVLGLGAAVTPQAVASNVQTVLNLPVALGGGEFSISVPVEGLILFFPYTLK